MRSKLSTSHASTLHWAFNLSKLGAVELEASEGSWEQSHLCTEEYIQLLSFQLIYQAAHP